MSKESMNYTEIYSDIQCKWATHQQSITPKVVYKWVHRAVFGAMDQVKVILSGNSVQFHVTVMSIGSSTK